MGRRSKTTNTPLRRAAVPGAVYDTTPAMASAPAGHLHNAGAATTPVAPRRTQVLVSSPANMPAISAGSWASVASTTRSTTTAATPAAPLAANTTTTSSTGASNIAPTTTRGASPPTTAATTPAGPPAANPNAPKPKKQIYCFDDKHAFSLHAHTQFFVTSADLPKGYYGAGRGLTFKTAYQYLAYLHAVDLEREDKSASMASLVDLERIQASISQVHEHEDDEGSWTSAEEWEQFVRSGKAGAGESALEMVLWQKFSKGTTSLIKELLATGEEKLKSTSADGMIGEALRAKLGDALMKVRERLNKDKKVQDKLNGKDSDVVFAGGVYW